MKYCFYLRVNVSVLVGRPIVGVNNRSEKKTSVGKL